MKKSIIPVLTVIVVTCFISCIKDFDLHTKTNQPQLVVEAYINNLMPEYNYVVLSRSLEYLSTEFQGSPVSKAGVFITEGEIINNQYTWKESTKIQLVEADLPMLPANFKKGVYFDPRLSTNQPSALIGTPGKCYLLEINDGDNQYSAITTLLKPVPLDSVTVGFRYIDTEDSNKVKFRITSHFKDPDTLNNTLLYYYRSADTRKNFGWGGLSKSRNTGTDDLTNSQYMHLTFSRGFTAGDTVTFYMSHVTRDIFNFWDTFTKARDNNGPFATPVTLSTNLRGNNVTGCFSGFSLSTKTVPIKEK
jgi:hypothetical protein